MAIDQVRLDDRTYDQLVEAQRRHVVTPEWTDHNPSDPGMMLIELLSWVGEMLLYRLDRVPPSHTAQFLDFLLEPPQPVTVEVTFRATFSGGATTVTIPAGTGVATSYAAGQRFVFDTERSLVITKPASAVIADGVVRARAVMEVSDEPLGVSDGRPHQLFQLRPPHDALGLEPGTPAPVLVDFVHRGGFEPNPRITVDATEWKAVPSLLGATSRLSAPDAGLRYAVDSNAATIRFGDDTFGAIPPFGAVIAAKRYAVLDGPRALRVRVGDVTHLLNPPTTPSVTIAIAGNGDAEGGANFHSEPQRASLGLRAFRAPYRLVTVRDFERAVLEDFNAFQQLAVATPQILRASVELDRRPVETDGITTLVDAPAHVTLVLVAGPPTFIEAQFRNPGPSVAAKQAMLDVSENVWRRLRRFLEPRRLITTRLNRITPRLRAIALTATVVAALDQNAADLEDTLRTRLFDFLSLVSGDTQGRGWRLGRNVYRSELFRLIEGVPGVDHVASLSLSPGDAQGNVQIGVHELPLLQALTLTVDRG